MPQSLGDHLLADQLLRIAREPELRREIYDRLGEYCHLCRNRLNSLKLSLYLMIRQSAGSLDRRWEEVDRHYQELERRVDQIQMLCRPLRLTRVTLGLDLLIDDRLESWNGLMERSGKTLEFVRPSERAVASFDVELLGQALDALVAWRAGDLDAGPASKVRWWAESGYVHLVWEESGTPQTSPNGSGVGAGATWTLPLLARIVLAHDGDIEIQNDRGFRLQLAWPTHPGSPLNPAD